MECNRYNMTRVLLSTFIMAARSRRLVFPSVYSVSLSLNIFYAFFYGYKYYMDNYFKVVRISITVRAAFDPFGLYLVSI